MVGWKWRNGIPAYVRQRRKVLILASSMHGQPETRTLLRVLIVTSGTSAGPTLTSLDPLSSRSCHTP